MSTTENVFSAEQVAEIRKIFNEELEKHLADLKHDLPEGQISTDEDLTTITGIKKFLQKLFLSELVKGVKGEGK
jgi:beta-phosphoglucomutase-like phosphatase (HAD superfamily)